MTPESSRRWEKHRASGMWRYLLMRGLLCWGVLMILSILVVQVLQTSRWSGGYGLASHVLQIFPYLILAGFLIAILMGYAGEREYRKYLARHGLPEPAVIPTGAMKGPRFIFPVLLALFLAANVVAMLVRTPPPPDLSQDEPPFCDMVLPPRSVKAEIIADTHGFLITVVDRIGGPYEFIIPGESARPSLYYGARSLQDPAARPLVDDARGREICLRLLTEYRSVGDEFSMEIQHFIAGEEPAYTTRLLYRSRRQLHRFLSRFE